MTTILRTGHNMDFRRLESDARHTLSELLDLVCVRYHLRSASGILKNKHLRRGKLLHRLDP